METLFSLQQITDSKGAIKGYSLRFGRVTYEMEFSTATGEWRFSRSAPERIRHLEPFISDTIAQKEF